jgi:hypothetical protein
MWVEVKVDIFVGEKNLVELNEENWMDSVIKM